MTRIIVSPYLSYLLLQEHYVATLLLFTAAGLTDWVSVKLIYVYVNCLCQIDHQYSILTNLMMVLTMY